MSRSDGRDVVRDGGAAGVSGVPGVPGSSDAPGVSEVSGVSGVPGVAGTSGVAGVSGVPGVGTESALPRRSSWRRIRARARLARQRVRAVPGGTTLFRVTIAAIGAAVVALGLVLVPLPGPGWAIVFGGLAIWAIEFAWAASLLHWVRQRVRAFARTMGRLHWTLRAGLGLGTAVVLVSIAWLWIKQRYGFETLSQFWEFLSH